MFDGLCPSSGCTTWRRPAVSTWTVWAFRVSVAFICNDALAIYRQLKARGIAATRPSVGNAMWVTQVVDPDGYGLFFESPTDAPEDTIFSEDDVAHRSGT